MNTSLRKYGNAVRITIIIICLLYAKGSFAQWEDFFKERIRELDPIEGIWDVEGTLIPHNAVRIYYNDISTNYTEFIIYMRIPAIAVHQFR